MAAVEKQKIVDAARTFLDEDKIQNLSDLNDFLSNNKLMPRDTKSGGTWALKYKNKSVCHIRLNDKEANWNVSFSHFTRENWFVDYDKYFTDDELIKFIWGNIHKSPSSNPNCIKRGCKGIVSLAILGKEHNAVCRCVGVRVTNPSETDLENIKKLILLITKYIFDLDKVSFKLNN